VVTARKAYGLEVLADAPSPISRPGAPVTWDQTRTLLLEDGSTAYGCAHCDYVSRNVLSIRPHLSKHKPREPKPGTVNGTKNGHGHASADSLTSLLDQLGRLNEITTERDRWKARALSAEKVLRRVRDVITGGSS
jgi:hypothetical protein